MFVVALLLACASNGGAKEPAAAAPPVAAAPAATAAPAQGAPKGTADATVVATWEGGQLTYGDIAGEIKNDLVRLEADYLTQRYDAEAAKLEERVNTALLEAEAKKQGLPDAMGLLKKEVEDKTPAATDAEIQELFDANARRMRGKTLDEVRPDVEKAVQQRKQGERYAIYISDLRKKYGVVDQLPYPDLPRFDVSADDDPFEGNADAPITIVQFAEYQCPYCGKARESVDQVMKTYEGKVRFVFRDFPLGFHDRAIPAATAANCAEKQGKYWQVHNALMSNQRALEEADLERVARDAGLDIAKWQACRQDPAVTEEIQKDMADGQAVGVTGTPAFFVNGVMLSGAQPYERFKAIIDRELQSKG